MNENKKNLSNKTRKILTLLIAIGIFITTLVGSIFGLVRSTQIHGPTNQNNNQKVVLQTRLGNTSIKDGINFVKETIDFSGLKDAEVRSFDNNSIQVTTPVNSFVGDKKTQKQTYENIYKLNNNKDYAKEVEGLIVSLFYTGSIEFRTIGGTPIFILDSGKVVYNEKGISSEKNGRAQGEIKPQKPIPMFSNAWVSHYNGSAYLKIGFKNRSDSLIDSYKNAFKNWYNAKPKMKYAVWFDYDKLQEKAKIIDPKYNKKDGLYYSYVKNNDVTQNWLKPFYVTSGTKAPIYSLFDKEISLREGFDEKTASYFGSKISSNVKFELGNKNYSNVNINLTTEVGSRTILYVMAIVFLIFIVVSIFMFSWYFGLLGFISSAGLMLSATFSALFFSKLSITITALTLVGGFIGYIAVTIMVFYMLLIYKKNNDKSTTHLDKFFSNFKNFCNNLFIPLTLTTISLFIAGFFLSTIILVPIYMMILSSIMGFAIIILILFPIMLVIDTLTDFTTITKNKSKWSYLTGINKNINLNKIKQSSLGKSKNITKVSSLTTIVVLLISILTGAIIMQKTGSPINLSGDQNSYYQYQVEWLQKPSEGDKKDVMNGETSEPYGIAKAEKWLSEANNNKKSVQENFNNNGIKVKKIDVVRNEYLKFDEDSNKNYLHANFGFIIYSNNKISSKQTTKINNSLKEYKIFDIGKGYVIRKGVGSIDKSGNVLKATNQTFKYDIKTSFYAILVMLLFLTIAILILFGWATAVSTIASMTIEATIMISPIFIFYIPYALVFWFGVVLFLIGSMILKTVTSKLVKKSIQENNKETVWFKFSTKTIYAISVFAILIIILNVFLIIAYGILTALSLLIVSIIAPIIIALVQYWIFPTLSTFLNKTREQNIENKQKDDIVRSKDPNLISEEYIEGINK